MNILVGPGNYESTRWMLVITAIVATLAISFNLKASFSPGCDPNNGPVPETDTDGDGIADCFDTIVTKGSSSFSWPDVCKTPEAEGPVPFPFTLRYGLRSVLSDFSDSTQGVLASRPTDIAEDASGNFVVLASRGLYLVDRASGFRSVISNFDNPDQGPRLDRGVYGLAIAHAHTGDIFTIGNPTFGNPMWGVYNVDPVTGNRTLISDFTDSSQGPLFVTRPIDIAIDTAGNLLVTNYNSDDPGSSYLYRIDAHSGVRTILSDFDNNSQGPLGGFPSAVAVDPEGSIFVTDPEYLFKVDPITGFRTIVTNFTSLSQGPIPASVLRGIAFEDPGGILLVDTAFGAGVGTAFGAIFYVDPISGIRQILSDFGDPNQGILGRAPRDALVGPDGVYVVGGSVVDDVLYSTLFKVDLLTATSGTITSKGDQNLKVTTKEDDPEKGVRIIAEESTLDIIPATVSFCGSSALVNMTRGDDLAGTCGSVTLQVKFGPVETQFFGDSGVEATTTLGSGNSISFEPTALTFEAPLTNSDIVTILVEGRNLIVEPGDTVALADNVDIDIKPGSDPNCFNNNGHGVIPVAILSRDDFDATQVDPLSVSLDGQAVRVVGKKGNVLSHNEDVNADGLIDVVMQIVDEDGTYAEGDASATLTGMTFDGTAIQGTDAICIVP